MRASARIDTVDDVATLSPFSLLAPRRLLRRRPAPRLTLRSRKPRSAALCGLLDQRALLALDAPGHPRAEFRCRCARTFARLPQRCIEHQRREQPREVSK